jgi:hypothetical protein
MQKAASWLLMMGALLNPQPIKRSWAGRQVASRQAPAYDTIA